MTGYAAFGRVERGRVSAQQVRAAVPAPSVDDDDRAGEGSAASTPGGASHVRGALATAREQWALTTYFLFDANSWR